MTPDANDLCVFAVKRGYIESKEIYCNPLYPTYLSLVEKYQHSPYANGILNNHVAVNPKTDCSLLSDSSEVSFVPMANVQEILKRENNIDLKIIKVDEHEDGYSDEIYHRIIDGIREASLVIADLSYGNKNVHHEIGYAQGIGKKVLLIYQIRDGIDPKEEIGSNISMHDQLRFTNIVELRSQLLKRIRNFFGIPESTD